MDELEFHPVSAARWGDLAAFFAQNGNPNYCWCMRWRLKSADFGRLKSAERRSKLEALVRQDIPTGVLAYRGDQVVGWCSIAPREAYPLLERSTTLKRIDDLPVWSVVCFFLDRAIRRQGLAVKLLQAAVAYSVIL